MSRKGERAFDSCSVKNVEFDIVLEHIDTGEQRSSDKVTENHEDWETAGYNAILHCPRVEDDRRLSTESDSLNATQIRALKEVRKLAGSLLCGNCIFSSMTPLEVSQHRTALANAERERAEAFTQLAIARKAAIQEMESVDLDFQISQLPQEIEAPQSDN